MFSAVAFGLAVTVMSKSSRRGHQPICGREPILAKAGIGIQHLADRRYMPTVRISRDDHICCVCGIY